MSDDARTHVHTWYTEFRTSYSLNDGQHGVDQLTVAIDVEFRATDATRDTASHAMHERRFADWLDQYMIGKDLRGVLDFAPSGRNLALYLARVFRQISSDVHAVEVGLNAQSCDRIVYADE